MTSISAASVSTMFHNLTQPNPSSNVYQNKELRHCMESQLFTNISRKSPIDGGHVSKLTSDQPRSTPKDPMVFVTVYELPYPTFTKRMRVINYYYINIFYA